jgi:hypothetical protein
VKGACKNRIGPRGTTPDIQRSAHVMPTVALEKALIDGRPRDRNKIRRELARRGK